jgi:hypothetical protein
MKTKLFTATATSLLMLSALTMAGFSSASAAEPTPGGVVIAQGTSSQVKEIQLGAAPTKPGQITATTQPGAQVNLLAKGIKQSKKANSAGTAVFTKLTAGKTYTLTSRGQSTKVTALNTVTPASDLTVVTTTLADSVALSWKHTNTKATGGSDVKYRVTATPDKTDIPTTNSTTINTATINTETTSTATIVSGVNPDLLYTFTVTPVSAMGPGESTTAAMSVTLRSLMSGKDQTLTQQKVFEAPAVKPTSTPTPAPAPAPTPGTKTIYVCPGGFTETGSNCTKTLPHSFTYTPYTYRTEVTNRAYSYHTETTGPMPLIDSFETRDVCPSGYNLEDYGAQGKWCRLYGPAPTAQVKDAPPAGFTDNGSNYTKSEQVKNNPPSGYTDNGTQWVTTNPAPVGYTDNGTEYISTASKEAKVVPA